MQYTDYGIPKLIALLHIDVTVITLCILSKYLAPAVIVISVYVFSFGLQKNINGRKLNECLSVKRSNPSWDMNASTEILLLFFLYF